MQICMGVVFLTTTQSTVSTSSYRCATGREALAVAGDAVSHQIASVQVT
jgi:hypothetical protein